MEYSWRSRLPIRQPVRCGSVWISWSEMPLGKRLGYLPFIQHASGFCDGTLDRIGFDTNFAIYDTEDQKSLMKRCLQTASGGYQAL